MVKNVLVMFLIQEVLLQSPQEGAERQTMNAAISSKASSFKLVAASVRDLTVLQ